MKIRVPATSANLGPGFDSCGIALAQYLYIEVMEETDEWVIEHSLGEEIASDENNLLIETALHLAPNLTPRRLKMDSAIPLTRGLGSSSSVIVAGIELANRLGELNLSLKDKVQVATEMEGHPDNVAPAICGDFVVASYVDKDVRFVKHHFPRCKVVAYIPDEPLATKESRGQLPETMPYREAVEASAIANVMIAAILNGNLPLAGAMMEKDRWHEDFRSHLVPHLAQIRDIGHEVGAYGSFLSGAGPTILTLCDDAHVETIVEKMLELPYAATIEVLEIDQEGTQFF